MFSESEREKRLERLGFKICGMTRPKLMQKRQQMLEKEEGELRGKGKTTGVNRCSCSVELFCIWGLGDDDLKWRTESCRPISERPKACEASKCRPADFPSDRFLNFTHCVQGSLMRIRHNFLD